MDGETHMNPLKHLYSAVTMTVALTVLLGIIYPFAVTGLAHILFKEEARGSLIQRDGKVIGSRLIGQPFTGAGYFHSRPSAAGSGYDASASGGTNFGPTNRTLIEKQISVRAHALRAEDPDSPIPVDLVTSSASGLDPHITPAGAEFQIPRIARERGMSEVDIRRLVREHTEGRQFGVLGEPRVNVLELNMALDAATKRRFR
jgi:potassium-transporting ATPase KdpC subunit